MRKYRIFFVFLVVLFLSGCNNQQNIVVKATPTIQLEETWGVLDQIPGGFHFIDDVSPNGEWVIQESPWSDSYALISIQNPTQSTALNFGFDKQKDGNGYPYFYSWSPDSSAIVGIYATGPKICCANAMSVLSLEKDTITESFILRWDFEDTPAIHWSNDSTKLALFFRDSLWLLDQHGKVLNKFPVPNIYDVLWLGDQILAVSYDSILYSIDLVSGSVEKIFALAGYDFPSLIGYDDSSNEVTVMKRYVQKLTLGSFNLKNRTLSEKTFSINKPDRMESSADLRYIGMIIAVGKDHDGHKLYSEFYIYDAKKKELTSYAKADSFDLTGWYENLNGFLVVSKDGKNHSKKLIIRP